MIREPRPTLTLYDLANDDLRQLACLGVVERGTLLSDTPAHVGDAVAYYFFNADGDEVAHCFHDLYPLTGMVYFRPHYPRKWSPEVKAKLRLYRIDPGRALETKTGPAETAGNEG